MRRIAADNLEIRQRSQSGYTLLELVFVLAILLILAAITLPRVMGMYDRHRLQAAVEDVRAHLAGSRLRAIDTGVVYQFIYEPNGQRYFVLPLEAAAGTLLPALEGRLPESLRFDSTDVVQIPAMQLSGTSSAGTDQAGTSADGGSTWSAPILFAPDGSATEAALDVIDEENRFVRLSIRGLTAAVTVGEVQQRSSL